MKKREEIERKSEDRSPKTEARSLKSEKMLSDRVNTLSDRDNTLSDRVNTLSDSREIQSGWVETLSGSQKTLSGRLAGQSVFKKNVTGRVNSLSGRVNPQSGKGFNLLMMNDYLLFPENKEHRIRNNESGNSGKPHRGDIMVALHKQGAGFYLALKGRHISARGTAPGRQTTTHAAPPFSAPALAPGFRLTNNDFRTFVHAPVYNFLFFIFYSLFPENKKHRIRNDESGNSGKPHRGDIMVALGTAPGRQTSKTPAPPFSAPVLAPEQLNNDFRTFVPAPVYNFLFFIFYFLFPENKEHRIRNNKSGNSGKPHRGDIMVARGNAPGWRTPTITAPPFSVPALATGFRLMIIDFRTFVPAPVYNFLFHISYFLFPENKKHRIRNNESGNSGKPHRGDIMVAQGNALGRQTTHPAPSFSAPALATGFRLTNNVFRTFVPAPVYNFLFDGYNACVSPESNRDYGAWELGHSSPRALPWAELCCPFRALNQPVESALKGRYSLASDEIPGHAPGTALHKQGAGFYLALKGRHIIAQGNALGRQTTHPAPSFNAPAMALGFRLTNNDFRTFAPAPVYNFLFDAHNACISNHGAGELGHSSPRALPWAELNCPVGASNRTVGFNYTTLKGQYNSAPDEMSGQDRGKALHKQGAGFYLALKGQHISARGNALGKQATTITGQPFNAPALATHPVSFSPLAAKYNLVNDYPKISRQLSTIQSHDGHQLSFISAYCKFSSNSNPQIKNNESKGLSLAKGETGPALPNPETSGRDRLSNRGGEGTARLINAPKFRGRLTISDCRTGATTPVFNFLFLISYSLFQKNKKHRISNNESGSLRRALKGQHISAQGNALGRRTPKTPGMPFSAPALATEQLINAPKFRSRLTINDFRTGATTPVFNFLFLISYSLFQKNKKHRISNNESGNLGTALKGRHISAQGNALGKRTPKTPGMPFNAPALATGELWLKPHFNGNNTNRWLKPTACPDYSGEIDEKNIPMSDSTRLLRHRRRTRSSQGAGS